ncbi:hypothetical protein D3C72_1435500 [compost metagenome]
MNTELFKSKFGEFSGELSKKFSNINLTEEELRRTQGNVDELATLISAKTGMPKDEVLKKVNDVTSHFDASTSKSFMDKVGEKYEEIKHKFTH